MFDETILPDQAWLTTEPDGSTVLSLGLRLPWYRSLPMSCIEQLRLSIDGVDVATDDLVVDFPGVAGLRFADLPDRHDLVWFVLDTVTVKVSVPRTLPADCPVTVEVGVRIPYGDPDFRPMRFVQTARASQSVTIREELPV